jgi:hypothetical protein
VAKALAVEEAARGLIKFTGNLDENEVKALTDFFNKYAWDIDNAYGLFFKELEKRVRQAPWQAFIEDFSFAWEASLDPDSPCFTGDEDDEKDVVGESVKISRIFLAEASQAYTAGAPMSHMPEIIFTKDVKFDGHRYGELKPYSNDPYFIESGRSELGDIQRQGDPFSYDDIGGGMWRVISAPESKKSSISAEIPDPTISAGKDTQDWAEEDLDWSSDNENISTECLQSTEEFKKVAEAERSSVLTGLVGEEGMFAVKAIALRVIDYIGWDGSKAQFENWNESKKLRSRTIFTEFLRIPSNDIKSYHHGNCKNRMATVILMANARIAAQVFTIAERVASGQDKSVSNYTTKSGKIRRAAIEISSIGENKLGTGIVDLVNKKWIGIDEKPPYDDLDWTNHLAASFYIDTDDRCGRRFDPSRATYDDIQAAIASGEDIPVPEEPDIVSTDRHPAVRAANIHREKLYSQVKPCSSVFYTCRPLSNPFPGDNGESVVGGERLGGLAGLGIGASLNSQRSAFIPSKNGRALQVKCRYIPTGELINPADTMTGELSSDDEWEIITPHQRVDPNSIAGKIAFTGGEYGEFAQDFNNLAKKCNDDWEYETPGWVFPVREKSQRVADDRPELEIVTPPIFDLDEGMLIEALTDIFLDQDD